MQYIIIEGNPVDGFIFTGPFEDQDEAVRIATAGDYPSDWWVAPLQPRSVIEPESLIMYGDVEAQCEVCEGPARHCVEGEYYFCDVDNALWEASPHDDPDVFTEERRGQLEQADHG